MCGPQSGDEGSMKDSVFSWEEQKPEGTQQRGRALHLNTQN